MANIVRFALAFVLCPAALHADADDLVFAGMCDASAAVTLDERHFAVANDEDNFLRIYDRLNAGNSVGGVDVASFLGIGNGRECDFEGAARIGNRVYWMTSHGLNKDGKLRLERRRFFCTEIIDGSSVPVLKPLGTYRADLLTLLIEDPRFSRFKFDKAATRAPKDKDGFNIEGLAAMPDGGLLIGFRNPLFEKKAIVIGLKNPAAVIENAKPDWSDPILLDLQGGGIRSMEAYEGGFLIVAGSYKGGGVSRLFRWMGPSSRSVEDLGVGFDDFNPEAMTFFGGGPEAEILFLSDDGTRKTGALDCKEMDSPDSRSFRGRYLKF